MDDLPEPAVPLRPPRTIGGNAAFHNFHNDYAHITDPNLRRRLALSEVDKIPFGWYHVRAVTVAGIGFFTDSYDIFAINLITSMLGMVFWQSDGGIMPTNVNTAIKASTSGGAVIGQLLFGWLADVLGRRRMYGVELAIIVLATLAQALSAPSAAMTMTGLLIFWRVMMGIGIGGDYPLSAVITSEFAPTRWRGAMMAAVFSMQGAGQFAAALVALITTVAFRSQLINTTASFSSCHSECQIALDRAWRIIVGFGGVPAVFALYYRITIPETPRYTFDIAHDIEKGDADIIAYVNHKKEGDVDPVAQQKAIQRMGNYLSEPKASWPDVWTYFSKWKNFKVIFGTTTSWFFLDLAFYGLGLNNSSVLSAIGYSGGRTVYHTLSHNAIGNLVLVCAGAIPGYWLSVLTVDTIGRKPIQIFGFLILTILFCVIGFAYKSLSEGALLALYVLAQLFFNFGPNTTTFIVPGECFPTRYRSTGHGISAAFGKIGAIVAQIIAQPLLRKGAEPHCTGRACSPWLDHLMQIFALFMLCGTLVSFLIPETKGHTLEELAGEAGTSLDGSKQGATILQQNNAGWRMLNPFSGGRPAGFSWNRASNLGPKSPGLRGKRARTGIMTSPALIAKKNGRHSRGPSEETYGHGSEGSQGSANEYNGADDELYINGVRGGVLPGWGAGWAVQAKEDGDARRERDPRTESIQLFDVGKLLR